MRRDGSSFPALHSLLTLSRLAAGWRQKLFPLLKSFFPSAFPFKLNVKVHTSAGRIVRSSVFLNGISQYPQLKRYSSGFCLPAKSVFNGTYLCASPATTRRSLSRLLHPRPPPDLQGAAQLGEEKPRGVQLLPGRRRVNCAEAPGLQCPPNSVQGRDTEPQLCAV